MASDSKDPLVGTRIREYEILDVIGKGGMGAVYRAHHVYLDEERAIKVINAQLAEGDSSFVDRFIREAKILTKLRHPDLVELYEFGRLDENMFFMVMEMMKGESLRQRMKQTQRIPVVDALRIIREAANGLHVAHQRGIIHRDISPDNLMLVKTPEGTEITKVIDFGIAKPLWKETHRYTIGQMFMGKPEFSSPEQCGAREEGEDLDARSDIYSLAVTLYYILSGKLPFQASTPQGYLIKHASEPPKPISAHFAPRELPDGIEPLIMKALSKKRDERHSSMAEFADDIEQIQNAMSAVPQPHMRPAAGELQPGTVFARRYQIERKLGRGGMGVVYKAIDKILDISVALKTMKPDVADDVRLLNRLKREVILARKISHPNVCRIYDIGESDGVHYVSMELLEGNPLAEVLLKQGAIPIPESLRIIRQVLDAVEAAHVMGVLHRDLKPQNIHVDSEGTTHIMDFGISTSVDVSRLTQTGGLIGTPRYMAPEQFSGEKSDLRADLYSIGIILYEMITGALPYEANTPASVMYAHLHNAPRKPSELISDLPPALEKTLLKALEKSPEKRFQTVDDFRKTLEPFYKPALKESPVPIAVPNSTEFPAKVRTPKIPGQQTFAATDVTPDPTMPAAPVPQSKAQKPRRTMFIAGTSAAAILLIGLIVWITARPKAQPALTAQKRADVASPAASTPKENQPVEQAAPVPAAQPAPENTEPQEANAEPQQAEPLPESEQLPSITETPQIETVPPPKTGGRAQYSVEIMATSWKGRAEEKVSSLNQKGYEAYLDEQKSDKATKYRVLVGRFNDYSKAKEMITRLKNEGGITGWIATISANETAQTTVVPNPPTAAAAEPAPASNTLGSISLNAPFPVKIYDGQSLVMDTAVAKSQKIKPGKYTFTMNANSRNAFIEGFRQKVEVRAGENMVLPAPVVGYFSFRAEPDGCHIVIDNTYDAYLPVHDLALLPGKHKVFIEWRALEIEDEITIEIRENQTTRFRGVVTDTAIAIEEDK
jgi:serine/threonine protein kinase